MSYYSGFQNKQQSLQYDQLLQLLLATLNKRILKFYRIEECDEQAFRNILNRIVSGLKSLEQLKFMPPRFSENVQPLVDYIQQEESLETDKLVQSNGFDQINRRANMIINQDNSKQSRLRELSQDIPTHPIKEIQKTQNSEKNEIKNERIQKNERGFKLEALENNKKSEKGLSEISTPQGMPQELHQKMAINHEIISKIEEQVTRNILDNLTQIKKSKKKKQRSQQTSFQFRKILLSNYDQQNQSFNSTRRTFQSQGRQNQ